MTEAQSSDLSDELVADLYQLARLRSLGSFRSSYFPALDRLGAFRIHAADSAGASDALRWMLTSALEYISDDCHHRAAVAIFGFGPSRWTPLRERQLRAAGAFGVGFDAYRRRRRDGVSLYDETISELRIGINALEAIELRRHNSDSGSSSYVDVWGPYEEARIVVREGLLVSELDGPGDGRRRLFLDLSDISHSALRGMAAEHYISVGELLKRALVIYRLLTEPSVQQKLSEEGQGIEFLNALAKNGWPPAERAFDQT